MKAAVLYGNDDVRYEEYPTPEVVAGTVRIRVRAAGICGSDIPRVHHSGAYHYPIVLGHEFSGVIDAIGEGVEDLKVGDTVSAAPLLPCMRCVDCQNGNFSLCKKYSFIGSRVQGAFADYVVLPAKNVVPYDPSIPFVQAAMFEPATVGLHGLLTADYRGGGTVAILGGGTIGIFTMQWARILGAKRIVVFDLSDERLALCRRLGADETVNVGEMSLADAVERYGDGRGFDWVFETAGSSVTLKNAVYLAANKGRVSYIGTPHTDTTFSPKEWELLNRKELHISGSWMSYSAPFPGKEWELVAHYFATGQLKFDDGILDTVYPLSEAAEAFARFKDPRSVKGKIMLVNE